MKKILTCFVLSWNVHVLYCANQSTNHDNEFVHVYVFILSWNVVSVTDVQIIYAHFPAGFAPMI